MIPGLVIRSQSGFYTVETETGLITARLRGRLKQGPKTEDILAVGDRVQVTLLEEGEGMIERIEPRERMISRLAPTARGEYRQIIIANPDQAIFVFSCVQPAPRLGMLDRYLVIAEEGAVPARIVANKIDLVSQAEAQALFGPYAALGYPLLYTSALVPKGIGTLKEWLAGKVSVFMGPSGAGKSSLLNEVQPGLGLRVREVSQATTKGKHTTVVRKLIPIEGGGYVADTPGMKSLGLWDIEPEELDGYFPELRPLVSECQFSNCTHIQEPGCAVRAAVSEGRVDARRYHSYLRMRAGDEQE